MNKNNEDSNSPKLGIFLRLIVISLLYYGKLERLSHLF